MRKQGKLYTVNKWNQPLFMPDEGKKNLFGYAGSLVKPAYTDNIQNSQPTNTGNIFQLSSFWSNPSLSNNYKRSLSNTTLGAQTPSKNFWGKDYSLSLNNTTSSTKAGAGATGSGNGINWGSVGTSAAGIASMIPETEMTIGDKYYKRGLWDAADPVYYLGDGRESDAGNALSDLGVSVTKASLASGQWYGALAGAGLKIIGGLANAAFGTKADKEKLQGVNQNIANLSNYYSNASSYDDLQGPIYGMSDTDIYEGGWFSKGKARRKNEELRNQLTSAASWADRSYLNNLHNIKDDQLNYTLANYAAYGGPLTYMAMNNNNGMSAIDYGFMSDYLAAKNQQNQQKNNMTNMFAGTAPTMFAGGGRIHINPKNKGKFNATKKRTGKTTEELTHSKNPLTRKRAIFAQNARKWKHADGGPLNILYQEDAPLFALGGDLQMHGGDYSVGKVYEVSEREANRLKVLGYEFQVIN